jgi:hypothetical protein
MLSSESLHVGGRRVQPFGLGAATVTFEPGDRLQLQVQSTGGKVGTAFGQFLQRAFGAPNWTNLYVGLLGPSSNTVIIQVCYSGAGPMTATVGDVLYAGGSLLTIATPLMLLSATKLGTCASPGNSVVICAGGGYYNPQRGRCEPICTGNSSYDVTNNTCSPVSPGTGITKSGGPITAPAQPASSTGTTVALVVGGVALASAGAWLLLA